MQIPLIQNPPDRIKLLCPTQILTICQMAPRKKMHLKMSSDEVVCCKKLPLITDKLSIEANSMDPEQTAPMGAF